MTVVSPISRLSQWRRLGRDERRTLVLATAMVPAMHVTVRVVGFNRLERWIARTSPHRAFTGESSARALRLSVVSINRVKRYSMFRGNCLSQSLALCRILRRRGLQPSLRLGVRLADRKFDAHAWVELDGRVLNDSQDVHTRFTPLAARPEA